MDKLFTTITHHLYFTPDLHFVGASWSLYCVVVKSSVGVGLTIPELFVRSVKPEVTEATLKDMLDTILCARALLRLLHPLLQGHQHPRKKHTEDKPPGSPRISASYTLL